MIYLKRLIIIILFTGSCQTSDVLKVEGDINNSLKEVSAAEMTANSAILWVIQDSGNPNTLIGLDKRGRIKKTLKLNKKNTDWEDLTIDNSGNIYIGDFGNNNKKRKSFKILKVNHDDLNKTHADVEIIEFTLPKKHDNKDFEAFFYFNKTFYILSKEAKKFVVFKVPNAIGKHKAVVCSTFNLKGKDNKITSADLSFDGKTLVLLNHDKLWKLTGFEGDDFFSGTIEKKVFNHSSQKEGICFKNNSTVLITDERNGSEGGNIYSFNLNH